tara:strand:- start:1000 stop:2631 length:1632 start_codon:yes stop_codon:yes gene_type:complete
MEKVEEDVENDGIQMNEIREVEKNIGNTKKTKSNSNNKRRKTIDRSDSTGAWFVSHQKLEKWNENELNKLQFAILLSLMVIYICHILTSPFIKFIEDQTAIIIIKIIESIILIIGIACCCTMWYVNGSLAATRMIFNIQNVRTYIYIFWILRSFIIEILKGQILYSFVHVFHSIVIYSTDMLYICNRKYLIVNILLFVCIVVYEFFISISPYGPKEPSWTFMNIKITANSLSRSNQFNLFVIFLDALIVIIYDTKRSKYVMLTKKQKRIVTTLPPEKTKIIVKLWTLVYLFLFICLCTYLLKDSSVINADFVYMLMLGINGSIGLLAYAIIVTMTTSNPRQIMWKLLQERRVIFVLLLLGILSYLDNFAYNGFLSVSVDNIIFSGMILALISWDMISGYIPKKLPIFIFILVLVTLCYNIYRVTFNWCNPTKTLPWGIYGQSIDICFLKRFIYQSILSLSISAAISTFRGRTDNLYFCNANIYRSTGTIRQSNMNTFYVRDMRVEQTSSRSNRHVKKKKKPDKDEEREEEQTEKEAKAVEMEK